MSTLSSYPGAIDVLFGDLRNNFPLTLAATVSKVATSFRVLEDISPLEVPCFLAFRTGEIIYVEAKDNSLRQLSQISRGASAQDHGDGETMVLSVNAGIFRKIKSAVLAVQNSLGVNPFGSFPSVSDRVSDAITGSDNVASLAEALLNDTQSSAAASNTLAEDTAVARSTALNTQTTVASIKTSPPRGVDLLESYFKLPAGAVLWFAGSTPPNGWLLCDGSTITNALYPALCAALNPQYPYSAILPDIRGRIIVGHKNGKSYTTYKLYLHTPGVDSIEGVYWGVYGNTFQSALRGLFGEEQADLIGWLHLPRHAHSMPDLDYFGQTKAIADGSKAHKDNMSETTITAPVGGGTIHYNYTQDGEGTWWPQFPGGSTVPHNNMQPSIVLNAIIKT